jgi:hypothetical protein
MRKLYHNWFCPFSRKARIMLAEKGLDAELVLEKTWERRRDFLIMNPAGTTPVLVEPEGAVIVDNQAVSEYLEEAYPEVDLLGETSALRIEVRRLTWWFDFKFYREVTQYVVNEKVMKRFLRLGEPDSEALRAAAYNIRIHLDHRPSVRGGLSGRRAMGRQPLGQSLVHAHEIPPQRAAHPEGLCRRTAAAAPLCRPRLLSCATRFSPTCARRALMPWALRTPPPCKRPATG